MVNSNHIKKAVIVAAGRSSRLYPRTLNQPKGLLDVSGEALLSRSVRILKNSGIEEIAVVVGFEKEKIKQHLGSDGITYIFNPFFAETNNLGSLFLARNWVGNDSFLYLHSDLVFDEGLIKLMMNPPRENNIASLLVDLGPTDEEAMKVRLSKEGRFLESNKEIPIKDASGEWVGIAHFSSESIQTMFLELEDVLDRKQFQAYDTRAFSSLSEKGMNFEIVPTENHPWIEVDFEEDYLKAKEIFKNENIL